MRAHRVTRRPADAADLEARPARDRRDDRGQRGYCEKRRREGAEECDGAEEPPRGVLARLWCWDWVGLLFDGLGRVQGPHREDLRPLRRVHHSHEGGDGLRDARPQAGQVIYQS